MHGLKRYAKSSSSYIQKKAHSAVWLVSSNFGARRCFGASIFCPFFLHFAYAFPFILYIFTPYKNKFVYFIFDYFRALRSTMYMAYEKSKHEEECEGFILKCH